jgi:hypothetical protein
MLSMELANCITDIGLKQAAMNDAADSFTLLIESSFLRLDSSAAGWIVILEFLPLCYGFRFFPRFSRRVTIDVPPDSIKQELLVVQVVNIVLKVISAITIGTATKDRC